MRSVRSHEPPHAVCWQRCVARGYQRPLRELEMGMLRSGCALVVRRVKRREGNMSLQMARPIAAEVLGTSDWVQAHEAVLGVARERGGLERREGVCLLRALREDVHRHLGYGAFAEYTDRHLGYGQRTTEDKLRTAAALEHLPELARAQQEGRLNASSVRELARVATAATEHAWIEAAMGLRVREVERLVSGRVPGDRPGDVPRPEAVKHVLRFEVSAETLAAFREATRRVAEQSGQRLDDDAALLLLARAALDAPVSPAGDTDTDCAGPDGANANAADGNGANADRADADGADANGADANGLDERTPAAGAARYQISVIECPRCRRGFLPAGADLLEMAPASLAAARCDSQRTSIHDPFPTAASGSTDATHVGTDARPPTTPPRTFAPTTQSIPRAVRRHVLSRDHHTCQI